MRPQRLFAIAAALTASVLATGCLVPDPITNIAFACTQTSQCAPGYACQLGRCAKACSTPQACSEWITGLHGEITTVGGTTYTGTNARVTEDGFEVGTRVCTGNTCVTGAISP